MVSKADIGAIVSAIRGQCDCVARRNGLQCAVIESWLAAVEEKCGLPEVDEPAVRGCLRVLERWVSPVSELAGIHALLVRLAPPGASQFQPVTRPSTTRGWGSETSSARVERVVPSA